MNFHLIEANLRQSFRILASGRPDADVLELNGISIASLGAKFQMFNAAFLNSPVVSQTDLEIRIDMARSHFRSRGISWAFWICDDWLEWGVRRKITQTCLRFGLRLSSELPGMAARPPLTEPTRPTPPLEFRKVDSPDAMNDFRAVGSVSFHVPLEWFSEVFEAGAAGREDFVCHVGYRDGTPVATSGSLRSGGVLGLYNIATAPGHRGRGYGEAITRHTIDKAFDSTGMEPVVLQSTLQGLPIYRRLGFEAVTRILVYSSL